MSVSPRPVACACFAVVLLAALFPLPGALALVAAVLVPVWLLGLDLHLIAVLVDTPTGVVQPIALRSVVGCRAPPVLRIR